MGMSKSKARAQMRKVIQASADKNGLTYEQAYAEMKDAIAQAYALSQTSNDPLTKAHWADIMRFTKGKVPTPEQMIMYSAAAAATANELPGSVAG